MQQTRSCLSDIERLAQTQSSDSRRELLRRLTDLFLITGDSQSEGDASAFGDVLGQIAAESGEDARAELSSRVGAERMIPRSLACQLAEDTIAVARPVLENCETFETEDLVRIARTHGQEHLAAIAGRNDIEEPVTDVLVDRGDDTVLGTVCANTGARFSDSGFSTAVSRARESLEITESLVARRDLPEAHRSDAVRNMDPLFEKEMVASGIDLQMDAFGATAKAAGKPHSPGRFRTEIDRLHSQGDLKEAIALRFARGKDIDSALYVIALLSGVDFQIVRNCLVDGRLVAIAVLFRALGFGRATLQEVLHLNPSRQYRSTGVVTEINGIFSALDGAVAGRILRFLKLRLSSEVAAAKP